MRLIVPFVLAVAFGPCVAKAPADSEPTIPRDPETGGHQYQGVVELAGENADELYSRARAWIAKAYRSAQDVIQLEDAEARRLIAKGNLTIPYLTAQLAIEHTLTLEMKDGRFRYTLDLGDVIWPAGHRRSLDDKWVKDTKIVPRTAVESEALIANLKRAMLSSGDEDDW